MFDSLFPSHWTTLRKLMWLKLKGASAVWSTISGNPVSFTAVSAPLRQLEVAFSPVQDLNGYDSPWPAGGGKNKLAPAEAFTQTINEVTLVCDGNGNYTLSGTATGGSASFTFPITATHELKSGEYFHIRNSAANGNMTMSLMAASDNIRYWGLSPANRVVNIQDTDVGKTVARLNIYVANGATADMTITPSIEADSSVTTYSPYSNECPISGWSSLTVEQRGRNLFDKSAGRRANVPLKNGQKIYAMQNSGETWGLYFAHTDGSAAESVMLASGVKSSITLAKDVSSFAITEGAYSLLTSGKNLMVSLTDFDAIEPYNGRSISISLGSTVYSGTVDVVTGVGEIDKATVSLSADMIYNYNANRNAFAVYRTAVQNVWKMDSEIGSTYSFSHGVVVAKNNQFASVTNGACCGSTVAGNQEFLFVKLANSFSDLDTAKAFVTEQASLGTPLQVCYELATPIPIQLTPQEVHSLAGDNVLFSDANGDLTVEYRSN